MPSKAVLEKTIWQWADTTDPNNITLEHVRTAYRLNLKPCTPGSCKRNCKANPYCLNCIGERSWFSDRNDDSWHDIDDPNNERRDDGHYVGLKNLGATCYVNTFLQLWFHNPIVRKAIYKFREQDAPLTEKELELWSPSSIGGHLQALFALLELTKRASVDPDRFITHLGLDAGQQQDAQEFSKLFLCLLEDSLSQQDPSVRNVIQQQFRGDYAYVTTCSRCGNKSERMSEFYELDLNIRGHKTLEESIIDFLGEEKMDGDNQYMCSFCSSKQNAKRAIQLKNLPPVLNLQLLRFVFDKKTGHKKKLNSFIQFPEVLDMSKFLEKSSSYTLNQEGESSLSAEIRDEFEAGTSNTRNVNSQESKNSVLYDLKAVLIHRGPTAYSGHYIAHIKKQNVWFKFNDEEVEKMKGSNLHLGMEDDIQEGSAKQKGRMPKGYHTSRNAYMLVYTLRDNSNDGYKPIKEDLTVNANELLPSYIMEYVNQDNENFEQWVAETMVLRDQTIENGKEKQEIVKDTFNKLPFQGKDNPEAEQQEFEWISVQWLSKWLAEPSKAPPIDNKAYMCKHDKLTVDVVTKMKCITTRGAEILYEKYTGGPRLKGEDALCFNCVKQKCHVIRTKQRIADDEKLFSNAKKMANEEEVSFWVGKSSMRSWRRLALEQLNENEQTEKDTALDESDATNDTSMNQIMTNTDDINRKNLDESLQKQSINEDEDEDDSNLLFNEDLLCEKHEKLDPDISCRKLVPSSIWYRLREYFPGCPEFRQDAPICDLCCMLNQEEKHTLGLNKQLAAEQKSGLSDLLNDRKRPSHVRNPTEIYVVSSAFVEEWRKFVRDPVRRSVVREILNSTLLCGHGGYLYPPSQDGLDPTSHDEVVYLWPEEWQKVCQFFSVDNEICIIKTEEDGKMSLNTFPPVCEECVLNRMSQQERERYEYSDAILYIRKVTKEKNGKVNNIVDDKKKEDPDYNIQEDSLNRSSTDEPPEKVARLDDAARRKSQRHRKVRGEKEVKVSSSNTLKELKLLIMKQFAVPPFDQNLSICGKSLQDDTATLCDLQIEPGAIIYLQADEPVEDALELQDMIHVSSGPESGFKGTGLLGANR